MPAQNLKRLLDLYKQSPTIYILENQEIDYFLRCDNRQTQHQTRLTKGPSESRKCSASSQQYNNKSRT